MALLLTAAATALLLAVPSTSVAATPCSKAILDDWLDNSRIDRLYDLPCYEEAIDSIPPDLVDYTDAADVISRAFQSATGKRLEKRRLSGPSGPNAPAVPPVDASASTALPLPLLVLGGMSALLLTAGGLGYVSRRRRQD